MQGKKIYSTETRARETLDRLAKAVDKFGPITIADLCTMTCVPSVPTDSEYGWRASDFKNADITKISEDQFVLDLPEPKKL